MGLRLCYGSGTCDLLGNCLKYFGQGHLIQGKFFFQVFGVFSLPCSLLCFTGVAIFSPLIALSQFLGALLAAFAALLVGMSTVVM